MSPVTIQALSEDEPGPKWAAATHALWSGYRAWFLRDGGAERPSFLACERALRQHMPELLPLYEQLVALAGGGDIVARFLSMHRPPAYVRGCSQGVWTERAPMLVRTYDYSQVLWERRVWRTRWLGRAVVGNSDCLWGLLDGVNDAGLALSLAFGGRRVVGEGFGIPLILRYALQVCETTAEAVAVLSRVPCHMAYTVTVLDACAHHATVFLSPDRAPMVTAERMITNHQQRVEWPEHAQTTRSVERLQALRAAPDEDASAEDFTARFLCPPVWSDRHEAAAGTLYAACYAPARRTLTMRWPDTRWRLPLDGFREGSRQVELRSAL
ncbi:MAG: putative choloylglycine hydrolase [Myxococcota bacterium]